MKKLLFALILVFFNLNVFADDASLLCNGCSYSTMKRKATSEIKSEGTISVNVIDISNKIIKNFKVTKEKDPEFGYFTYAMNGGVKPQVFSAAQNLFTTFDSIENFFDNPIQSESLLPYIERNIIIDSAHKLAGSEYNKALLGKSLDLYLENITGDSLTATSTFLGVSFLNSLLPLIEGSSLSIIFTDGTKYDYKLKGFHFNLSSKEVSFEFEPIKYSGKDGNITIPESSWNGFEIVSDATTINRFIGSASFSGASIVGSSVPVGMSGMSCKRTGDVLRCNVYPLISQ